MEEARVPKRWRALTRVNIALNLTNQHEILPTVEKIPLQIVTRYDTNEKKTKDDSAPYIPYTMVHKATVNVFKALNKGWRTRIQLSPRKRDFTRIKTPPERIQCVHSFLSRKTSRRNQQAVVESSFLVHDRPQSGGP